MIEQLYSTYGQFEDKFAAAQTANKRLISDAQSWLDKAKFTLDKFAEKTLTDPQYIAYDMLNNGGAEDIFTHGEFILEKNEKQKGYPSLQGLDL